MRTELLNSCELCYDAEAVTAVHYNNVDWDCCRMCFDKYTEKKETEPTKPEPAMMYTIMDVKARLAVLDEEIDYLLVLTDSNERIKRDVPLDRAPATVLQVFGRELHSRQEERDRLQASLDYHMEHTILDFAIKGAGE